MVSSSIRFGRNCRSQLLSVTMAIVCRQVQRRKIAACIPTCPGILARRQMPTVAINSFLFNRDTLASKCPIRIPIEIHKRHPQDSQ